MPVVANYRYGFVCKYWERPGVQAGAVLPAMGLVTAGGALTLLFVIGALVAYVGYVIAVVLRCCRRDT